MGEAPRLAHETLETLPVNLAVVDATGEIRYTNRAWREFGGDATRADAGVGADYLAAAEGAEGDDHAAEAASGLRAVLSGEREVFSMEYPCHGPESRQWFLMYAAGFPVDGRRHAAVVHIDITDRRLAEIDADETAAQLREERQALAHLLDRVEGLIHEVTQAIVEAETRSEMERRVCDCFAATEPYTGAWIYREAIAGDGLRPVASGDGDVEGVDPLDRDGSHPASRAQVDGAVREGPREAHPGEVLLAVPLTYGDVSYGVLCLAAPGDTVDERERAVIASLARTTATAVNALTGRRILSTDELIELEVRLGSHTTPAGDLAAETGGTVSYRDSMYREDGSVVLLVEVGVDADAALAAAESLPGVASVHPITGGEDSSLLEIHATTSLVSDLADLGAVTRSLSAEAGETRLEVEVSDETVARRVFDFLEAEYPPAELVGYREREREPTTDRGFRSGVEDALTDRQYAALRKAYFAGFYEWPRPVEGEELADAMDVSRSTFHEHRRAAERKLVRAFFADGPD